MKTRKPDLTRWKRFAALALASCLGPVIPAATAQVVNIPDPVLKAAIRVALNKPLGDILSTDLVNLTVLNARRRTQDPDEPVIRSLEGLQAARNLRYLNLSGTISLTTPQELLPSLSTSDLSPLSGLANLQFLDLSYNGFTSLTLPDGLRNLGTLFLTFNLLTDLDFAMGLPSLHWLDVSENGFTNLTLSEGFTNLGRLDVSDNLSLTNFSIVSGLTNLRSLDLGWWRDSPPNPLRSVHLHAGMTKLQVLDLTWAYLPQGHTFLRNLTGLTQLYLWGSGISSVGLLSGLTNLQVLNLSNNQLGDLTWPPELTNLVALDLSYNGLTSLTLPRRLTDLRILDVSGNALRYLGIPESVDVDGLLLYGFDKRLVTILMLRIGPASVQNGGGIRLPLRGTSGERLRVQRSTNLTDWEDWTTVTLGGTSCELFDTAATVQRFYRAIEDRTVFNE